MSKNPSKHKRSRKDWMKDIVDYYEFYDADESFDTIYQWAEFMINPKTIYEFSKTDRCDMVYRLYLLIMLQKAVWEIYGDEIHGAMEKNRG